MSTSQMNSLLSFENPPVSLPWTMNFNMGSILPISSGAVGKVKGWGFGLSFFVYFCISHTQFSFPNVGTVPWNTDTCGGTSSGETQTWVHSVAHWWVFPGAKLRTEPSLKLFFPLNKICQVSSPWKTSAYQHHAVCVLTAGKDSSSHSVKEISFSSSYSVLSSNNVPNVQFLPSHSTNHCPNRK